MRAFRRLIDAIEAEGSAALVTLTRIQGSSPREAGARMVVRPSGGFFGTIGGGAMEWRGARRGAHAKHGRGPAERRSLALGPELAQCCGGRVEWRIETFDRPDLAAFADRRHRGQWRATLKASLGRDGRVERRLEKETRGEALTARLPGPEVDRAARGKRPRRLSLRRRSRRTGARAGAGAVAVPVRWIDLRARRFPRLFAGQCDARSIALEPPAELAHAPDGALVDRHDPFASPRSRHRHAAALRQDRFGYVGLIGSATKRARF